MSMTNYMELLMTNQPWNLIMFMVIPVGLAECLVATEFYTLYLRDKGNTSWKTINKLLGIAAGIYFSFVFLYIVTHILPQIEWRGAVDIIAVISYLCGVVPLLSITLLEFGIIGKNLTEDGKIRLHFIFLIGFLIVSHVAMIFGMVDPGINAGNPHHMHEMHENHHMN